MRKVDFSKVPESFFVRVRCHGCGSEQTVFSSASRLVKCLACGQVLAEPGPGKVALREKSIK